MAYVNVAEWKTDLVCEWLKGLENSVLPYVHSFTNNKVNGQQLLNLRPEDLEQLGVFKLGHQEIILEAVEYLRNFHYEVDRENLQLLALRLSCQAHSLHNELCRQSGSKPLTTQTLSDVVGVVTALKPLVRWLDRPPFSGQLEYNDKKTELLKLSIEMSTCAQRDRFAEKPIEEIRNACGQLARLADYIIQDVSDPMILQPSSLDLATLKKRPGDDLGFFILPSFHGTHQVAEIKFSSAAHQCGKMEEGDEIVQVNYQTIVGWERKNVLELFNESPSEVLLTLKRRPRHTKVYGQIYIKPYRLPSNKKTSYTTRWQHNLPSPRPELLTIPDFTMPLPRHTPKDPSPEPTSITDAVNILDTMTTDSSESDSEVELPLIGRLYGSKPRNLVQRRATITGASPTTKHAADIEQFWKELKHEHNTTFQLRDKAASCAHGLDNVPSCVRPQTCLGIEQSKRKKKVGDTEGDEIIQFNEKLYPVDVIQSNETKSNNNGDITVPSNEVVVNNSYCRKERGRLDKSHSTPAYDLNEIKTDNAQEDDRGLILDNDNNEMVVSVILQETISTIINNNENSDNNNSETSRESSQEKSESTSSYMEGIYSSSSENDTPINVRPTPPEPPPRKYFTKPPPLNLSTNYTRPKVPERPEFNYRDFVEKSMDFIDEPLVVERQLKEEKSNFDKYELFTDKFGSTNSIVPTNSSEFTLRTTDSPDGAGCSRQMPTPELKIHTLEKDKHYERGVVNRAMMVARSIGLHSGPKMSAASPKSSRKRNILLAKRRNVAVKDITPCDLEGWLTHRSRGAGGAWARAWFVLKGSSLYRFKNQESIKSDCLIMLPGFTGSQAAEVKSRKYAFKVYHTGTVFYFAADTDDYLSLWLDSINKATLGADCQNRTSGLFSETDESDTESKSKTKSTENKTNCEKTFGKTTGGASLDRKYLRFLGARTQNVPVPTAQFRSYRRVLPSSIPNRKLESANNSPDRRVAGSTFYDLSSSQSVTDVLNNSPEMSDYRQQTERLQTNRNQRIDDLRNFVTLEEFMLSQNENCSRTSNPATFHDQPEENLCTQTSSFGNGSVSNGMIYGHPKNGEESSIHSSNIKSMPEHQVNLIYGQKINQSSLSNGRRLQEGAVYYPSKQQDMNYHQNLTKVQLRSQRQLPPSKIQSHNNNLHINKNDTIPQPLPRRFVKDNNSYSGSSGDLRCYSPSETFQRARKEASVSRKGSFNLNDRCRDSLISTERHWIDSLRRSSDKKSNTLETLRLKNVAQYQPPPMPMISSSFDQEQGMSAAFEMHLDKSEQVQKTSRLKSLFSSSNKSPHQKPNALELTKEPQKTILGSPRLHRALFRDRSNDSQRQNNNNKYMGQNSGDSGFSQLSSYSEIAHSQSYSSVSSAGDWSPERRAGLSCGKSYLLPPTLPYIPPPTSPPPDDYPGLEYPPVFEPGTYSLSDPSLLRTRNKKNDE